jgi:MoaA/NifB/PqqE/SkfB family radical SAM enzyme
MAELSHESQLSLLEGVEREIRARVMAAITTLSRSGAVELDSDFMLDANEGLPVMPRLRKLHLELTHRCNFACKGCYLGAKLTPVSASQAREGTTEQWLRLIGEAATLGCVRATVTGGEPFIRRDILEILDALSERGITFEINTNGSCISENIARALKRMLISSVEITLYGHDADSVLAYTGARAGYTATLKGIHHLAEQGVPLSVKYFATAGATQGFEAMRAELEAIGVPVKLTGHTIHGDLFEGELPKDGMSANIPQPLVTQERGLPCAPSINGLGIEPDGRIRACPKLTVHFGNAFEQGLEAVWQKSTDLRAFRAFWIEYCKSAGFVRGARLTSRCPAAHLLSKPNGLAEFRTAWTDWRQGGHS